MAFRGKVGYFGGNLIMMKPKANKDKNLDIMAAVINYLNSVEFMTKFTYSGRFKIGHRQLSKSLINLANFS